ncbi:MAG: YkgJ family cysteine cluster protein [Clostridiales bacterium]
MENTATNKLAIKLVKGSDGMLNYDVQVLDREASVQDYLDALNDFQEEKVAPCDGCSNCCWERVPLTAPDVLRYAAAFYGDEPEAAKADAGVTVAQGETSNKAFGGAANLADEYGDSAAAHDDLNDAPGDSSGAPSGSSGAPSDSSSAFDDFFDAGDGGSGGPSLYFGNLRQKDTRQNLRFIREYAEIRGGDVAGAAVPEAEAAKAEEAAGMGAKAEEAASVAPKAEGAKAEEAASVAPKAEAANTSAAAESPGLIDIYLRRLEAGNCVFLDLDKQRCRAHALRPLVCQSYVCLPSSRRAEALRRQIVNEGENELIRVLGEQVAKDWQDYRSKGFAGKERFADVALRDVVNEGLWQRLLAEE